MILVVDSGGTKTEWWAGDPNKPPLIKIRTRGFHPFSESLAKMIFEQEFPLFWGSMPDKIQYLFFYGAGMENEQTRSKIKQVFSKYLHPEHLEIAHDLLGAARALWKKEEGLIAILGTGSIVGYYAKGKIQKRSGGYGYLIGDEGSGFDLGKRLLRLLLALHEQDELNQKFRTTYGKSAFFYLQDAYNSPQPNRLIAQLAPFLLEHKDDFRIAEIINQAFHDFFSFYVNPLRSFGTELRCIGSIAWHFRNNLIPIAKKYGIEVRKIAPSAIQGLWEFHTQNLSNFS